MEVVRTQLFFNTLNTDHIAANAIDNDFTTPSCTSLEAMSLLQQQLYSGESGGRERL